MDGDLRVLIFLRFRLSDKEHRAGFQLVSLTAGARSTVRVFLSALKLYYRVMRAQGFYHYDNPLVDGLSAALAEVKERLEEEMGAPRMPQISGAVAPEKKQRLSDSYFKLVGEVWVPQVIDNPQFPVRVLAGGQKNRCESLLRLVADSTDGAGRPKSTRILRLANVQGKLLQSGALKYCRLRLARRLRGIRRRLPDMIYTKTLPTLLCLSLQPELFDLLARPLRIIVFEKSNNKNEFS